MFKTTATDEKPLDGATVNTPNGKQVSDFITVQSFANFSAMTGAIVAAWNALQLTKWAWADERIVPLLICLAFGLVSILVSKLESFGQVMAAIFIAALNSLVLFGAVMGAAVGLDS